MGLPFPRSGWPALPGGPGPVPQDVWPPAWVPWAYGRRGWGEGSIPALNSQHHTAARVLLFHSDTRLSPC